VIADLHCHYPMHLLARAEDPTLEAMVRAHRRPRWVDKLRAFVLKLAARLLNFRRFSGTWRVDLPGLETGDVRVVLSVLYLPFAEMDLDERFGARPESGYFADLVHELDRVRPSSRASTRAGPVTPSSARPTTSRARRPPAAWPSCTASRAASTSGPRPVTSTAT
jgi:hypothetical protein